MYKKKNKLFHEKTQAFALAFKYADLVVYRDKLTIFANITRVFSFKALFDCSNILKRLIF